MKDQYIKKFLITIIGNWDHHFFTGALPSDRFTFLYYENTDFFYKNRDHENPDLILLGVESSGTILGSLKKLKSIPESGHIPVIICTAELREDRELLFRTGACDYILLPAGESEIISRINIYVALKQSRERGDILFSIIYSMRDILFVMDEKGIFTEFYQTGISGELYMPPEFFLGKSFREILPQDVAELTDKAMRELLETGNPQQYEYPISSGGTMKWFSSILSMRKSGSGSESGVVAVIRDITERKAIEVSLQKQKDFNEILIQNSPAFIVAINSEGKTILMNKSMMNALAYTMEEVINTDYISTFIPPEDRSGLDAVFSELISQRKTTVSINRIITREGKYLTVEWHGVPVFRGEEYDFFIAIGFDVTGKIETEQLLKESEERYRTLFEKSKDAMLIIDNERFTDCNEAALDILHYKNKEDLLGTHPSDISPQYQPDGQLSFEKAERILESAMQGISHRFEWVHRKEDGEDFWVEVSLTPVPFKNKKLIHTAWRDITEKKKAEKALTDNERFFRVLANNIPGVAYQFFARESGEIGFYYISERSREILGLENDLDNFLTMVTEAVSEEFRESFLSSIDKAIKTATKWDFECKFIKPDGDTVWVRGISEPVVSGDEIIFNGVIIDITERKNAERAMRLLNYSLDHTKDGVFWFDDNARISYVNDAACSSLGYKREQLKGMFIYEVDPDFSRDAWDAHLEELRDKGSITYESRHITKDAKIFPVEITANYIMFEGQEGTFTFVTDITQRKRAEAQLLQAQKMETVGTLAGGLAHDFNNILSGITGPLSLINYRLEKHADIRPEVFREYLKLMYDSSIKAADIIQHLLSLSRKQEMSFTRINLNTSVSNVMKICRTAFDKSVILKPEYYPEDAVAIADPTQIEQVVLNMCVNAEHAMTIMKDKKNKWGGTLSVVIEKIPVDSVFRNSHPEAVAEEYWFLSVNDTGVGIKPEVIPLIFDPFYSTKEKGIGTGLGLSIVYSIIRQHQGFIDVYSEIGHGTSFKIYLPSVTEGQGRNYGESDIPGILKGEGKILVIDDETTVRKIASDFLEECGYMAIQAESISEAMDIFGKIHKEIRAVLLDLSMPEISGKDVFLMLKKIDPGVRVLLTSGFRKDDRVDELLGLGVKGFIQKPVTIGKLSEIINFVIHS